MSRLRRYVEREELSAFQEYLGEAVTTVSPLLLRLCGLEGWDLDELAAGLKPLGAWPTWLCGPRPGDPWRKRMVGGTRAAPWPSELAELRFEEILHGGHVVQGPRSPGIPFGMRVLGRGLEPGAILDGHRIRTFAREGAITLRLELPHTLVAALPGRPLDRLVSHSLLDGAGCVVTHVVEPRHRRTEVNFALEPVPWRLPWARSPAAARPDC